MSHFTRVKVRVRNREFLIQALRNLGYTVEEGAEVRGWRGQRTTAEIVVRMKGEYDVGFVRSSRGEDYQAVADWMMAGLDQEAFVQSVQQEYALVGAEKAARKSGWTKLWRETQPDGTVVIMGRRSLSASAGY